MVVGEVSSLTLAETRIAKSEFDAGPGGMLKRQLRYKGEYAGRCVKSLDERNTTRAAAAVRSSWILEVRTVSL